jgi:hypothetical protein
MEERNMDFRMKPRAEAQMERRFKAQAEAEELLGLIVAEFESDPMSVQCFDERIVERAKRCVATLKANPSLW